MSTSDLSNPPELRDLFPERTPPALLYHYTTPDALRSIVESKHLWATNIHYLNDSQEFKHAIEIAQSILGEGGTGTFQELEIRARMAEILDRSARMTVCVFSLSENGNQLSQWRAYCRNGGYAIGFKSRTLDLLARSQGFVLGPCVYDHKTQGNCLRTVVTKHVDATLALVGDGVELSVNFLSNRLSLWVRDFIRVAPALKHQAFEEEHEWRLISTTYTNEAPNLRFHSGKGLLIPHLEFSLGSSSGEVEIARVVVGPSANAELANESLIHFLNQSGVKWYNVIPCGIPYREW